MTPASPSFGSAVLLASAGTLLFPEPIAAAILAGLALLWCLGRLQPGRWLIAGGLLLAALCLAAVPVIERASGGPPGLQDLQLEKLYAELWRGIEAEAEGAAAELPERPRRDAASRELLEIFEEQAFELFERRIESSSLSRSSLLLFDPDGEAFAWAGEGFLYEPDPYELPVSGRIFRQGHTSATLMVAVPLSDARRPWRLVAGRSFATDRWPFPAGGLRVPHGVRWWLGPADMEAPDAGFRVHAGAGPALFLETEPASRQATGDWLERLAWALLGLTVLALPMLRLAGGRKASLASTPLLAMTGFTLWARAAGLEPQVAIAVTVGVGLAVLALVSPRAASFGRLGGGMAGGAGMLALAVGAWLFQSRFGRVDLAAELGGSQAHVALRFAGCLFALAILRLAARRRGAAGGDRLAWGALAALVAGAAVHDWALPALGLLILGGGLAARWTSSVDFEERPAAYFGVVILAALASGLAWEISFREELRRDLASDYLPNVTPPTPEELDAIDVELFEFFDGRDLDELLARAGAGGNVPAARDLAYVLWRESPLAHRDGLSALVVDGPSGPPSFFTFGLSLDNDYDLTRDPARWHVPAAGAWRDALTQGEFRLMRAGERWGRVRCWFLPRPGFRLDVSELGELDAALIRGQLHRQAVDGLPPTVRYGLHDRDGRAVVSPWKEEPPLPPGLLGDGEPAGRLATPAGRMWFWKTPGEDGIEILYLPILEPFAGLERVGTHALGALIVLALVLTLGWLFAFSRDAFRTLIERTIRSYSKRLLLVYTLLLLLPLVALNLFLLRGFENRLRREQQADAYEAIGSAGRFIQDYLLRLEPGSSLLRRLDRQRLEWVASMVHHQVNLYWGSDLYASSQPELFTTGLLPERIPGDVYRRVAIVGRATDYRSARRGDMSYRTYYAPLQGPGISPALKGFFLSVPLLEQEEDVRRELAAMRRRAALTTTALFLILVSVGSRLARSFTTPIMQLIEGTRKIAGGAPYLDVTPREHELSSLADAIDEMAQRIAAGRRRLLLEKQLVERIVDNIASAVVSIDHDRRVLLCNKVAAELLGVEGGEVLLDTLAGEERFEGLADFLERAFEKSQSGPLQETLKISGSGDEGREWTVIYVPWPGPEDPAALLVVDDVTEVVRGQRLEAWAEMARIIAHEIKNPLTPIQLSAEHMRQVYATDREGFEPVLERCTDNILDQVAELREIASEFSTYSRIPQAELVQGDLVEVMRELTDAYRDAASRAKVAIELVCELEELPAKFDRKLIVRAMRNLLENALRASAGRGRVGLHLGREGDLAVLRVTDRGPGVEPANLRRIFEPYFSTHESGTGLGLAITRRIIEDHGGRIEARNRPEGGLEVLTTLPILEGEA